MRNVFDQYEHPENRLTHALVCTLAEDRTLLRRFVKWATGRHAPGGSLLVIEQQRPGDSIRAETDARGLPDAWIHNDVGWALLIESKIAASVESRQLRRHLDTAARRGFSDVTLLTLTARQASPSDLSGVVSKNWADVYSWLLRQGRQSKWARRCTSYMEVLEANLIERSYLKEGKVTSFAGVSFNAGNPYNYLEAKRLLRLALDELRAKSSLAREMAMDPSGPGRKAITGKDSGAVWDFLRLRPATPKETFTKYPHLTLTIERERVLANVTIPHGIKAGFRRRLVQLGPNGFRNILEKVTRGILDALRGDGGAAPAVVVVQRRYPTQRSAAIVDAHLEYDLRTAFPPRRGRGVAVVKSQPQWLDATFSAFAKKSSNLQLAIGASFPYGRSKFVSEERLVDRVADTWMACRPLLSAMGILGPTRPVSSRDRRRLRK